MSESFPILCPPNVFYILMQTLNLEGMEAARELDRGMRRLCCLFCHRPTVETCAIESDLPFVWSVYELSPHQKMRLGHDNKKFFRVWHCCAKCLAEHEDGESMCQHAVKILEGMIESDAMPIKPKEELH